MTPAPPMTAPPADDRQPPPRDRENANTGADASAADEVRAALRITGRVQGVWYRGSTVREAERLGLRGWVRNRPDGSVAAEAQGPRAAVEALIAWCRDGPPPARVAEVAVEWRPPVEGERSFAFRR